MKALIFKGKVVDVQEKEFPVHKDMKWLKAPKGCAIGWAYENGKFSAPPAAPEPDYKQKRVSEYPEIGDQLDAIMKWVAGENEITVTPELKSIAMKCMSVKAKYPKPEGS